MLPAAAEAGQQIAPPDGLTFEHAVEQALAANPSLAAARARGEIDRAGVAVAGERLNPEARIELERETPTRAYGLSVPWEAGGKRARRVAVGEAALRSGEAEVARLALELRASVRRAYFGRAIAEARLGVLVELETLASRVRDAAQQRFDAGSAPRLEVLQAQLALAQAANETTAARGALAAARSQLNALLALPLDAATPLASSMDEGLPTTVDTAIARAQTTSVELAVLDRRIEEQQARVALARALQVPDVSLEGTITRGAEPEFSTGWRAAVAVAVPVFTRHQAGVRLEEATLSQLGLERAATSARVAGDVSSAATLAATGLEQYRRYRDEILPQALEVARMADDSYRLGQTGIAALLQALQASRDARLRSLQIAADFQNALADLERAVGAPLP